VKSNIQFITKEVLSKGAFKKRKLMFNCHA
jgi:hypothetical protein